MALIKMRGVLIGNTCQVNQLCLHCVCRAILLGSRGFDVPKLSQRLDTLNAAKSLDAIEPVWETDIEVGSEVMTSLIIHVYHNRAF